MRSLSYILTGRPRNRTDCIDYMQHKSPSKISIELMTNENVSSEFVMKNLYVTYVWVFDEFVVAYEEAYGRCVSYEPYERQCTSIDNANRRLSRALENLHERTGLSIEGEDMRFNHDLAYEKP